VHILVVAVGGALVVGDLGAVVVEEVLEDLVACAKLGVVVVMLRHGGIMREAMAKGRRKERRRVRRK
jgi:hypothetical protein